ncbi:auxin-binding protein ABP20-like [Selaginella moellendorffii]|nr:auxin-binding protein ABP20-like [Selaginella moellendorffii]XP_024530671.1 auxin-binding protein ABP20-like [Selaginella moellendorffii]|eukprot:XP_024522744.1 auxin-binding protein ABP20-like [Selaginella moellendorffii]
MNNTQGPNTFNATLASVSTFPGLNTMGLSIARVDFGVGGVVPTHVHPRASELVYVAEGTISAGFVDTNNVLFARTLQRGDLIIIPRGLLHYLYNVGSEPAIAFVVYNSQEAGLQLLGPSLFGSEIPTPVLASSLSLNESTIAALRGIYAPSS